MDFNFFRKKQSLDARHAQRAALAARLVDAEQAVVDAQRAAVEAALEGRDNAALDKAEANIRATQARVFTLNDALAALDVEIEAQSAKEAADADAKQRAATAREINKLADAIENSLPDIMASLRRGHVAIEAGRFCFGDIGLYKLLDELESSLPSSFAILASEMRGRAEQTIAGRAPASLPVPEPVLPPAPPISRQQIFALQNLKWTDPASLQPAYCERFNFASPPAMVAAKALETGIAVLPDDERVAKLKHLRRGAPPIPETCHNLDTGEAPAPSGALPFDAFRRIDRGPPTRMSLAAPTAFEPVGARSLPVQTNEPDHE